MIEESSVTLREAASLLAVLATPSIAIGTALQVFVYRRYGGFKSGNRLRTSASLLTSAGLTFIAAAALWVNFPGMATDVLNPRGESRYLFAPALLSAFIVYPIVGYFVIAALRRASGSAR